LHQENNSVLPPCCDQRIFVAYGSCRDGLPENLPYEKRGTLEEKKLFQFHISKGSKRYKISHECAFSCLSSNSKRRESGGRGVSSSSARVWKTTSNDLLLILCINATKQTLQHRPVVFLNYQESTVCQFKKKRKYRVMFCTTLIFSLIFLCGKYIRGC
jgi:hypothetical protein